MHKVVDVKLCGKQPHQNMRAPKLMPAHTCACESGCSHTHTPISTPLLPALLSCSHVPAQHPTFGTLPLRAHCPYAAQQPRILMRCAGKVALTVLLLLLLLLLLYGRQFPLIHHLWSRSCGCCAGAQSSGWRHRCAGLQPVAKAWKSLRLHKSFCIAVWFHKAWKSLRLQKSFCIAVRFHKAWKSLRLQKSFCIAVWFHKAWKSLRLQRSF